MIEHFNTAEGWPQTEAETIALDVEGLHSFSEQCAVEPAEPSNCLACLAYMELGRRDRIFPQRGRAADRAQLKSDRMLEALEKLEALKQDLESVWADPDGHLFMVIIDLERALGQELLTERRRGATKHEFEPITHDDVIEFGSPEERQAVGDDTSIAGQFR